MPTGNEPVPERLQMYVDYINNTGQVPLSVDDFDEDHEPIGLMVRNDLLAGGFIYMGGNTTFETEEGIYLRPDLVKSNKQNGSQMAQELNQKALSVAAKKIAKLRIEDVQGRKERPAETVQSCLNRGFNSLGSQDGIEYILKHAIKYYLAETSQT